MTDHPSKPGREGMPEKVWCFPSVDGSPVLVPRSADPTDETEYIRADLHTKALARIELLEGALREYGEHDWSCALGHISPPCGDKGHAADDPRCDCGLRKALEGETS